MPPKNVAKRATRRGCGAKVLKPVTSKPKTVETEKRKAASSMPSNQHKLPPTVVSALDENVIADHLETFLMADDNKDKCIVMHAILDGLHLYVFPPSAKLNRNWYTVVTAGVSGVKMNVPTGITPDAATGNDFSRCELMCYLPADWKIPLCLPPKSEEDRRNSWPFDMLRSLGGYILNTKAWFSHDHGVPSLNREQPGMPFADNTVLANMITLEPVLESPEFAPIDVHGVKVNMLLCVPLTTAEAQWKVEVGAANSIYHIVGDRRVDPSIAVDYVIDASRQCAVERGYRRRLEEQTDSEESD